MPANEKQTKNARKCSMNFGKKVHNIHIRLLPFLPAYDFPDKVGYMAPGVHLFMENQVVDGLDVFSISQVTVSVAGRARKAAQYLSHKLGQ